MRYSPITFGAGLLFNSIDGGALVRIARDARYIIIALIAVGMPIGYKIWPHIRFKVEMKDTDSVVAAIATLFLLEDATPARHTPFKDQRDPTKLDYSMESLRFIDEYLRYIRKHLKELSDEEYTTVILRCGAYCGEVMKREMHKKNEKVLWITYKNALKIGCKIKDFGESPLTFYLLYRPDRQGILFPMAKVGKFLDAGMAESLYVYARAMTGGIVENEYPNRSINNCK